MQATAELLEGGATVPFIARYRKEATGTPGRGGHYGHSHRLTQLAELDARREAILSSLQERGLLTDELKAQIAQAATMTVLEDIYLPYRPKRRTRATMAREKGLEPLATLILAQDPATDPLAEANAFVDAGKGVESVEAALAGARDIIAEWVNEDQTARTRVRELFHKEGTFRTKVVAGKEAEGCKFEDYFDWEEPVAKAPSHRILAMRRGASEGFLRMQVIAPEEQATRTPRRRCSSKGSRPARTWSARPPSDGYKRLLAPSMETEILHGDQGTGRRGGDPGLRGEPAGAAAGPAAGPQERPGHRPRLPHRAARSSASTGRDNSSTPTWSICTRPRSPASPDGVKIAALCQKFEIEAIAIGNGTAGRETEDVRPRASNCPTASPSSWSTRAARPSTPPPTWPARSSPTRT